MRTACIRSAHSRPGTVLLKAVSTVPSDGTPIAPTSAVRKSRTARVSLGSSLTQPPVCVHAASRRQYAAANYKTIDPIDPVIHAASRRPAGKPSPVVPHAPP
ncbi:hypothetical protein ISCGN_006883 [Ixodes scapularis]